MSGDAVDRCPAQAAVRGAAGPFDAALVTIFPVISGKIGTHPTFGGIPVLDLEPVETRTLDGRTHKLTYRLSLYRQRFRYLIRPSSRFRKEARCDTNATSLDSLGERDIGEWTTEATHPAIPGVEVQAARTLIVGRQPVPDHPFVDESSRLSRSIAHRGRHRWSTPALVRLAEIHRRFDVGVEADELGARDPIGDERAPFDRSDQAATT